MTLYVVFVRSEALAAINPMMYVFGYRIFDVQLAPPEPMEPRRVLLLSKTPLRRTMEVDVVPFGDECYVAVEEQAT